MDILEKTVFEDKFNIPNSDFEKVCMLLRQQMCHHEWKNLVCLYIT